MEVGERGGGVRERERERDGLIDREEVLHFIFLPNMYVDLQLISL